MSYYKYMVSVYRSCRPELNRTLRSSSVERSFRSSSSNYDSMRQLRSASVGPSSYSHILRDYSAMPFTYAARQCYARAASLEPVTTYSRAYYDSFANKYNDFDYKVMSYAHQLDAEETTRCYVNRNRYEQQYSSPSSYYSYKRTTNYEPFTSNYDYYSGRKYEKNYLYDSSDALSSFRHYRLSNQTLNERNQRAKSPLISREIDRYYKPRPDYMGDVNSGPNQGFRHYSYRHVPYFGGSDYYQYVPRVTKFWNNEVYPSYVPV